MIVIYRTIMATNNNITLVTDALTWYDGNNEKYRNSFKNVRYTKFLRSENDMEHNVIIMYNDKKEELFRSKYEIIGLFNSNSHTWVWAWSIPNFRKNNTHIVRKILNYGAELDPETRFLKMELITSRFRIADPIQLDMHVSIASYLSKKPLIYKHIVPNEYKVDPGAYFDIKSESDHYTLYFMFLLDYAQFDQ